MPGGRASTCSKPSDALATTKRERSHRRRQPHDSSRYTGGSTAVYRRPRRPIAIYARSGKQQSSSRPAPNAERTTRSSATPVHNFCLRTDHAGDNIDDADPWVVRPREG
jgi:hypothetical protein